MIGVASESTRRCVIGCGVSGFGTRSEIREETWRRERFGGLERFVDCGFHAPPRRPSRTAQARRRIPEVNPERTVLR